MSIDLRKHSPEYVVRPLKWAAKFGIFSICMSILLLAPNVKIAVLTVCVNTSLLFLINALVALYRNAKYKPFDND